MKIFILILLLLCSCSPAKSYKINNFSNSEIVFVKEVIDGDTFIVLLNNKEHHVRLLGVDFPDLSSSRINNFIDLGLSKNRITECYNKGKKEVENIILNKNVTIIQDFSEYNTDEYNRLIRYVEFNNSDIGYFLLENGYARFLDIFPYCLRCNKYYSKYARNFNFKNGCLWKIN